MAKSPKTNGNGNGSKPDSKSKRKQSGKGQGNNGNLLVGNPAWVKGKSGNPNGRPKNSECLTALLREEIEKIDPADLEGRTWKQKLVLATMRLACEGVPVAFKEAWERLEGKVTQPLGVDGADGMEVTFKIHAGDTNPVEGSERVQ